MHELQQEPALQYEQSSHLLMNTAQGGFTCICVWHKYDSTRLKPSNVMPRVSVHMKSVTHTSGASNEFILM